MVDFSSVDTVGSYVDITFGAVEWDSGNCDSYAGGEVDIGDSFGGAVGDVDFGSGVAAVGSSIDVALDIGNVSFGV